MLFIYPALFHKEDGAYWVEFPDLEGCQTFGDTLQETMANSQEALTGYLLTLVDDGSPFPNASDISEIACPDSCFATLIACDLSKCSHAMSVKKTLTIPSWLNERAMSQGINFSRTLQDALIAKVTA